MEVPVFRKILGVVTAATAGLLLVGVAWAAGDRSADIASADSAQATTADSSGSNASVAPSATSSGSVVTAATGTSLEDSTSTSSAGTAPSTSANSTSTSSISVIDTSSTSTTIDNTTSTSQDDGSTTTTIDDNDREETRGPAPVDTPPTSYQVGAAGTVTVQVSAGRLILIAASAASGWSAEVDRADGEEVKVEFESGEADARFEARVHNGELRVRIDR